MQVDDMYHIWDDAIPKHWVLTVRKCRCGQRLWWDNRKKTFHCLKPTCPNFKSHIKEYHISAEIESKIIEFGEYLTIPDISKRLKVPVKEVVRILEENEIT